VTGPMDRAYVTEQAFAPTFLEWNLVGVDPDAIDPHLILRPPKDGS